MLLFLFQLLQRCLEPRNMMGPLKNRRKEGKKKERKERAGRREGGKKEDILFQTSQIFQNIDL